MKVDLHFHSKFSDGSLWPNQLVEIASKKGIKMMALTDHDTFEGVPDFLEATKKANIIGIPAIEINFSDTQFGFQSELLAYFPKGKYQNTYNFVAYYQRFRKKVVEKALEKAQKEFNTNNLSFEELVQCKVGTDYSSSLIDKISLTRRDVYTYLNYKNVHHRFFDFNDFKRNFFNDVEFIKLSTYPEISELIRVIKSDEGFPVLAHPAYQFGKDINKIESKKKEYVESLNSLKNLGLWGIEMHSYDSKDEANNLNPIFFEFAKLCALDVTYGSDFHSEKLNSWRELGCMEGEFNGF